MRQKLLIAGILFFLFSSGAILAEEICPLSGCKRILEEKGLYAELIYTGDWAFNTRGGLKTGSTYLSSLDLTLTVDTQKANLWENGKFFFYGLNGYRQVPLTDELVGDMQGVSNIEVPRTTRLLEAWYEHIFCNGHFSALMGIHDFNSEFAISEYGLLYINGSFGIQSDISLNARPSLYPLAGPAVRFKLTPNETWEFLLGVYDGDPGDPENDEHLPRSILASDQGLLIVGENIFHFGRENLWLPGTFKTGLWFHTGDFDDITDVDDAGDPEKNKGNIGGYFIADQMIYREKDEQGLGIFLQVGGAPDDQNEIDFYIGGGVHYRGLVPGRDEDETGIAVAHASVSNKLVAAGARDEDETVIELTYRSYLKPWFVIQPDIQFILNPGAVEGLVNSVVPFLRFEIHY